MQVIRDVTNIKNTEPVVCALGNFDGLHFGHKHLLNKAAGIAKTKHLKFAVMTFEPHPAIFFKRANKIRILSLGSKLSKLESLAVDMSIVQDFNNDFANLSADDFVTKILLNNLNVKHIVIGHDFIFGKNRKGNAEFLKAMAEKYGFGFTQIQPQYSTKQSLIYSSTEIRRAIRAGDVKLVKELMGHEFTIYGNVRKGNQIGGELGYHTANLDLADYIRPKYGVYAVKLCVNNKYYDAVANIGVRPTITNSGEEVLEIHIFDFNAEIYGKNVIVEFVDFIRDEKKFASSAELISQIANDCDRAKSILAAID
ncbi:MAG: bifunctional riboflavin kinase/FAD synthetase [Rickettsiales bacterium]|jgi:riboflavin kinase / FMN adenylyltransferase|nr:bifunctional riboflavin kinase/FAD synthetase [Rickettsiales bacterium]